MQRHKGTSSIHPSLFTALLRRQVLGHLSWYYLRRRWKLESKPRSPCRPGRAPVAGLPGPGATSTGQVAEQSSGALRRRTSVTGGVEFARGPGACAGGLVGKKIVPGCSRPGTDPVGGCSTRTPVARPADESTGKVPCKLRGSGPVATAVLIACTECSTADTLWRCFSESVASPLAYPCSCCPADVTVERLKSQAPSWSLFTAPVWKKAVGAEVATEADATDRQS